MQSVSLILLCSVYLFFCQSQPLFLTETVLRTFEVGDFTRGGVVKQFRARNRAYTIPQALPTLLF